MYDRVDSRRRYNPGMRRTLRLHPDSRCHAAVRIEAEAARPRPGSLSLRYCVAGDISRLRLPPPAAPARADGLWRRTCFEAFLRASPGAAYYELNFAPSLQWAAYRFAGYRAGRRVVDEIETPRIEARRAADRYTLRVVLELDGLPDLPGEAGWRLGLSAVIEDSGGETSYWALAHPPGGADFHHSDCFTHELPAAKQA